MLLQKVIRRMQAQLLFAAWEAWRERCRESCALTACVAKVVHRLRHVAVAAALGRWVSFCNIRAMLRRVGLRLQNLGLSWSFAAWTRAAEAARTAVVEREAAVTEAARQQAMERLRAA